MINIDTSNIKKIATPITIGAFVLMSVTGILMFFHANIALNKLAHEWLGWAFVAGGLAHLFSHYRSFFKYLQNPKAIALIAVFIVILIGSFFQLTKEAPNPTKSVMKAVNNTPIAALFPLTQKSGEEILANLAAKGFEVRDPQFETIENLSNGNREKSKEIINIIFSNEKSAANQIKKSSSDARQNFENRPPMPRMRERSAQDQFRHGNDEDRPMPPRENFEGRDNFKMER